jgi:ubiquinone/menaquinone biosynthesis C-methylase UbiE
VGYDRPRLQRSETLLRQTALCDLRWTPPDGMIPLACARENIRKMLTPKRAYIEELLDLGEGTDDDVARSLGDIRRINRFLGGTRVVLDALQSIAGRTKQLSLLDVGTGSADIPTAVARWCRDRGVETTIVGLDISERNLRVARSRLGIGEEVNLVRGDSLRLPFPDKSFDVVTASLFLHHFRDDDVARLLRDFGRVASRAVIINDLVRNLVPYYFARVMGVFLARSYLTRSDAPASVLRAFTTEELEQLATRAGLRRFVAKRLFPYRLSMIAMMED